jgi:hypothetical protein
MATREQVAFRLREYERRESQLNDEGMITLGTLRLALRALDTERDAALGRLARQCDPAVLDELVGDCRLHMLAPYDRTCDALNAIAAHLRAEGGA